MTFRSLVGSLAAAVVASLPAAAAAQPVALTQEEAVARTLGRHPALRAASQSVAGAQMRASEARTAWLPRLTAVGSYTLLGPEAVLSIALPPPINAAFERQIGNVDNASATLKAGWRAWDFGARDLRVDAAEASARAAVAEGADRAAEIAYASRAAYLSVLLYGEVAALTDRSLETARAELEQEKIRRQAGIGDDVAVAGAEARVAELDARLEDARQGRERSAETLAILLGLPAGSGVELTSKLEDLAAPPPAARAELPSVTRLEALRAAVLSERSGLGRAFLPVLDVFGQIAYQYPKTFVAVDEAGLAYAAGVSLTWELFDGDLKRRQRAELAARAAELDALAQAAREDAQRREAEARSRQESAGAAVAAAERALAAAEVYQRAAQASQRAGTGTSLDVRKAEEGVDRARLALLRARFDAALARADRLRALGIAALPEGVQP